MKIGILLCGEPTDAIKEEFGDYAAMYARLLDGQGLSFVSYSVFEMDFPASALECDGWLISGSKYGVYEDHPFISPLEDFVRDARAAAVPMVGICFGHQIIAQALGGQVEKYEGGWSIGRVDYTSEDGTTVALNAWHQDQVITPPKDAHTTSSTDFCAHSALVYPDGIWTMQPHPEFDNEIMNAYLHKRARAAGVPEALITDAMDIVDVPINNLAIGQEIAHHFKKFAKVKHV